jgi:uridine kinase
MSFVVAIAGGSGSGKSLLCAALKKAFGSEAVVFPYDAYNKDQSRLTPQERDAVNYDVPDAYDQTLFLKDLLTLKSGHDVRIPVFDYASHTRTGKTLLVKSAPLILAEGFLVLAIPECGRYFDFGIYVDADGDVRLARRILRDEKERGYPAHQVIRQYLTSVKPMHEKYIEPSRKKADFVFVNNGEEGLDQKQLEELISLLRKRLAENR